jgi:hypothetical protein
VEAWIVDPDQQPVLGRTSAPGAAELIPSLEGFIPRYPDQSVIHMHLRVTSTVACRSRLGPLSLQEQRRCRDWRFSDLHELPDASCSRDNTPPAARTTPLPVDACKALQNIAKVLGTDAFPDQLIPCWRTSLSRNIFRKFEFIHNPCKRGDRCQSSLDA